MDVPVILIVYGCPLVENRERMTKNTQEQILKLGKQRRIFLHCPNCSYFGLIGMIGGPSLAGYTG